MTQEPCPAHAASQPRTVDDKGGNTQHDEKAGRPWPLAKLKLVQGQRGESDKLPLRNKDDACDQEHQNQRDPQERIDCTVD